MSDARYLIDENLPPDLVSVFTTQGYLSSHVNDIVSNLPVKDSAIRKLSLRKNLVLVTRDDDFVKSYVSRAVPERLIYVFGKFYKKELLDLFSTQLHLIVSYSQRYNLVEVNARGVRAPLDREERRW